MSDLFLFDADAPATVSFTEAIKTASRVKIQVSPDGQTVGSIGFKIPGQSGHSKDDDRLYFKAEKMDRFGEVLENGPCGDSDSPDLLDVAMDTLAWNSDGGCSFYLSHKKRARVITLSAAEASEFGSWIRELRDLASSKLEEHLARMAAKAESSEGSEG